MHDPELIAWVKDGENRYRILKLLVADNYLPSELARKLDKHRASISRTQRELIECGLVLPTKGKSRTKLYSITPAGKRLLEKIGFVTNRAGRKL